MVPSKTIPPSTPMSCLSDSELIEAFVEGFLQGQSVLLSNPNLRTEPLFDSVQLISKKEGVIATAHLFETPITIKIRQSCDIWPVLHTMMAKQDFHPITKVGTGEIYLYRHWRAPEGYEINCTTAKELWRACWGRGFSNRSGIPMELLICRQGPMEPKPTWQALRGMDCDQGQLLIKILGRSAWVEATDLIVWALQRHSSRNYRRRDHTRYATDRYSHLPLNQ